MRPAQGKQEKRKKPKWRWLNVHAMHIADVAQERRKNAKMTVSVCSRYALCVIVKCFAMQLWTVLGGIWIYMTSTGTGRKKVIINVWSQKSGNFLQTFDPDSYLIIAISKFVLHSGKKYKTLAKNKQNKKTDRITVESDCDIFGKMKKKPQTKCKLQSHKVVDGPFGEGGAGFLNGQHLQLLLASICSLCILNHNQ